MVSTAFVKSAGDLTHTAWSGLEGTSVGHPVQPPEGPKMLLFLNGSCVLSRSWEAGGGILLGSPA